MILIDHTALHTCQALGVCTGPVDEHTSATEAWTDVHVWRYMCIVRVGHQKQAAVHSCSCGWRSRVFGVSGEDPEKTQKLAEDLHHFWRDVLPIMDSAAESSSLHNVARFSCMLDRLMKQQSTQSPDGAVEPKVVISDNTAKLYWLCYYKLPCNFKH